MIYDFINYIGVSLLGVLTLSALAYLLYGIIGYGRAIRTVYLVGKISYLDMHIYKLVLMVIGYFTIAKLIYDLFCIMAIQQ